MAETNGSRTHEPSLREVVAELDGLRQLFEERHKWYEKQDKDRQLAVDKALAAVEKQTASAFDAAKEANGAALIAQKESSLKTEEAQKQYNVGHNDLIKKMDQQNRDTMPRTETENRFKNLEEKIALLTGSFTQGTGMAQGAKATKEESRSNLAIIIAFVSVLMTFAAFAITHWK
jgi:hypothetical protein